MQKCNRTGCKNDATTKGFVFIRDSQGRKHLPTDVFACDKHKKTKGFFEYKTTKVN
ncbi:hypothetical protein [Bacillus cereus group sp. BfR-BA-01423]|uniref:hypothetical protein n=1 Tax=Bacillus cereus group sp. BfR-BA-01423 TaxID=2920340 RepID=UPI001F5A4F03|nr:hypothetical protein [Bacillus cereus group sp. BfR-BA-01423]